MTIAVVGLGLIGGSLAKAIRSRTQHKVFGADQNEAVLCKAELLEAVHERLTPQNIGKCDLIILAVYPRGVLAWLREHAPQIAKSAVVMDTCGIKQAICEPAWEIADAHGFVFMGGHPMAGVERTGFDASVHTMFENASMILTPREGTEIEIIEMIKKLSIAIGFAHVEITTPARHDQMIAFTSQLAHVVSSAYVKSPLAQRHRGYSAGSYRDMTRVATLNETLWTELFMNNRDALAGEIDAIIERLAEYSAAIKNNNADTLRSLLREGRELKAKADGKVL